VVADSFTSQPSVTVAPLVAGGGSQALADAFAAAAAQAKSLGSTLDQLFLGGAVSLTATSLSNGEKTDAAVFGTLGILQALPAVVTDGGSAAAVTVTEKGLALVANNLARFEEYAPNTAMVQKLLDALSTNTQATGAAAQFYLHEIAENTFRAAGMTYDEAHAAALAKYGVSNFNLYSPDVVRSFSSEFNDNFRAFWGF
jgi:filamentous hemagglutinin